jgi:putative transposase
MVVRGARCLAGGFYAWLTRPRSQRSNLWRHAGWHDMLAEDMSCGLHRIERLMRCRLSKHARDGGVCRRIWVSGRPPPSLPMCSTAPSKQSPNRKWIADFTYVWTAEGWLAELPRPRMSVPRSDPGTARFAASTGRCLMMISCATKLLPRLRTRGLGTRKARPVRKQAASSRRSAPRP